MNLIRIYAVLALAGAAGLALAQTGPSTSSASKKELVAKALQLQQAGVEGIGNQLAVQTSQQILGSAGQAMGRVPADKRELVGSEIQAEVRKFYEDISPALRSAAIRLAPAIVGAALDERMSEDELKTLVAWLESPVSKKYQQLAAESSQALTQKVVAETSPSIEPKLKAIEASISKKLGMAPPPASSAPAATAAPAAKPAASGAKK